jgi:hypothetical protein
MACRFGRRIQEAENEIGIRLGLITARVEPVEPYDETTGLPDFWAVVTSRESELRTFPGPEKALAEIYASEFTIKAFEVYTRLSRTLGADRGFR